MLAPALRAGTLNVPADYSTIQSAIDASVDGDTILVQPGTYVENINYGGKNIVVGSLFLTTADTSYISQTIIDGNSNGTSVVMFVSGEDSTAALIGLTIQNGFSSSAGNTDKSGGGIYIVDSSPAIKSCKITGNTAVSLGGGIWIDGASSSVVSDTEISNNFSGCEGGGIFVMRAHPIFKGCLIKNNTADCGGGGGVILELDSTTFINTKIVNNTGSLFAVSAIRDSRASFINCILSNNNAQAEFRTDQGSVVRVINCTIFYHNSVGIDSRSEANPLILNTIVYSPDENTGTAISLTTFGTINIENSLIKGGYVGAGNIDVNPEFINPAEDNFKLQDWSPAIGAGLDTIIIPTEDIEGNLRPNPVGSNPDIGAYENPFGTPQHVPITLNVPSEYSTIQAALNAALTGDTVLVQPGTYIENLFWPDVNGIKLISAGDSSNTIIDGDNNGSVISFLGISIIDTNTVIKGFKITNGYTESNGGGVFIVNSAPLLYGNLIENNFATEGGGSLYIKLYKCNYKKVQDIK